MLFSNAIEGKHFLLGSVLDWGISRSQSINKKPYGTRVDFRQQSAFRGYTMGSSFDMGPPELLPAPENLNEDLELYYFYESRNQTYDANEVESSFFLNWETPFRAGIFSGFVKAGAKYRLKHRDRTNQQTGRRIDYPQEVQDFLEVYPDYTLTPLADGKIQLLNFLDDDYAPEDFLNGEYEYLKVDEVIDSKHVAEVYANYLQDWEYFIGSGAKDDYVTDESIQAYYLMSEMNFGKYVTFIPGVRYERTSLELPGLYCGRLT